MDHEAQEEVSGTHEHGSTGSRMPRPTTAQTVGIDVVKGACHDVLTAEIEMNATTTVQRTQGARREMLIVL